MHATFQITAAAPCFGQHGKRHFHMASFAGMRGAGQGKLLVAEPVMVRRAAELQGPVPSVRERLTAAMVHVLRHAGR